MAVNQPAIQAGVQEGQFLALARTLIPDLIVHSVTPEYDAQALEQLAEWCRFLSPLVAVDPPDGLWIDSTGGAHLFGGEKTMLEHLKRRLADRGHVVRGALADTAGAAHALARFGSEDLICVSPGATASAIDTLSVAALRLDTEILSRLQLLGIARIADLRAVPRAALARRFGATTLSRLDQALGRQKESLSFCHPAIKLTVKRHLMEPICTAESIEQAISVLCQDIAVLLQKKGLGARKVDLLCQRVDDVVQAIRVGTSEPVNEASRLCRLLQERIETIDPGFGIEVMSLHISHAQRYQSFVEESVLSASSRAQDMRPLRLLAERLQNRPDVQAIYYLAASDNPFPEAAQKSVTGGGYSTEISQPLSHWPRPTRLFAPPRAIAPPRLAQGETPCSFVWQGQTLRIHGAEGPERLHGAWWQHPSQAGAIRDYWIVETEEGDRFWLFRRGDGHHAWSGDGAWFVHGLF